ncbi:MAG: hydantoinase/carbamoylase family amidase [Proteobacteria bacterium]|nr:hydantoinase/carbamoylase family amidase [Pseudomonadota bacterium]
MAAGAVPEPDVPLAARLFDRLRAQTSDGIGITRASYGEGEQFGHDLVAASGRDLGLEVATDFAGNLYVTLPGRERSAKRLILGSHIDSVPQGGNFDGAAGVLAGLAVVAGLKKAEATLREDVTVMAIRAEETPWFPYSFLGSRAALGTLPPEVLDRVKRSDTGLSLAEHMRALGFEPERVRRRERYLTPGNTAAFIEVHIEQGPVLVEENLPVAVVTGIQGSTRWRHARITGRYGHSGGVPRRYRRDAVAAFVEFAHRVDRRWIEIEEGGTQMVATFCVVSTDPGRATMMRIAGEVAFGLDVRSTSPEALAEMDRFIAGIIPEIESRRRVTFDLGPNTGVRPALADPGLRAGLVAAARAAGIPFREMPSGGGHDTQAFLEAGIPAAMLFVRNENDSHNPDEAMAIEDFAQACRVLMGMLWARA